MKSLVALRKESVDRNQVAVHFDTLSALSLSARRAWIEILDCLRAMREFNGRSPQGERG